MSRLHRVSVAAYLLAAILAARECEPARGQVVHSTFTKYLTGQDPYTDPNFGSSDEAFGAASATLDYSGAGPLGGTFSFSGAAESAATALKTRAAVTLSDYPLGSFYTVDAPVYDHLPISGIAYAMVRDEVRINGASPTYDVEFVYHLTGTAARGAGNYEYYFRPTASASAWFQSPGTGENVGFDGKAFYPENGVHDSVITLTARGVPSNAVMNLHQSMQVLLYSADSQYSTDIDPFETDDWDPSHIIHQTSLIGEDPYSVSVSADFGHTLALQNVVLRLPDGSLAADAWLVSRNGVQYPGQAPEPTSLGLIWTGLGVLALRRR